MNIRALLGALLICAPTLAQAEEVFVAADFSQHTRNNATEFGGSPHAVGANTANAFRMAVRFPVIALVPIGASISKIELLVQVLEASGNAADLVKIGSYAGTGQEDAQADAGALAYTRSAVAAPFKPATDELRTVGAKVVDITAAAADLLAAVAAGKPFTIALQQVDEAVGALHYQGLAGVTYGVATQRPALRITFGVTPEACACGAERPL